MKSGITKNTIIFNLIFSIIQTGIMLYILSLLIYMPVFSEALGINNHSFHIGLIVFSILYTQFSELSSIVLIFFQGKFEFQADRYASETFNSKSLIEALKILSKDSLSNLTPTLVMFGGTILILLCPNELVIYNN